MPLETELRLEIEPSNPDLLATVKDYLVNELKSGINNDVDIVEGGIIRVFSDGFRADEESSGIEYFGEVEQLLANVEKVAPGYKATGDWQVDFTVVDAPPDHWTFEWVESKVTNVINASEKEFEQSSDEWADVFSKSKILKPEMFMYYMLECGMPPQSALVDMSMEDADEPFDDDGALTFGEALVELAEVLGEDPSVFDD